MPVTSWPSSETLPQSASSRPVTQIEQCRLARAVGADDRDELMLGHVEVDRIHGGKSTEAAREGADARSMLLMPCP